MSANSYEHVCKSCLNKFNGNYCNLCGEKVLTSKDKSFKTVVNSIMLTLTFADSRFVRALWLIIKSPGTLSRDFAHGIRVKNLSPMSVFFVLNLIYFFFPLIQLFSASLNTQLLSPFSGLYKEIITQKIVNMGMDLNSFAMVYNLKTNSLAKLMVMVFVVIASIPLNFLYWKRNKYFTDHVTYSVELACFNLSVNVIFLTLLVNVTGLGDKLSELILTLVFITTNLYFVLRSSKLFYAERGWQLVIKTFFMIAFLKVALEIYRAILFFVTIIML
jgi:hypothetical protein